MRSTAGVVAADTSVQEHFGGGDITEISVSGVPTGGGDSGHVTISLEPKFGLPQNCSSQQVAKWNGSAWVGAADNDITYTAGTGEVRAVRERRARERGR